MAKAQSKTRKKKKLKVDAEGRTLYRAYGWSKENALGAEKLAETNKGSSSKSGLGSSGGSSKKAGSGLKDEETISKRAGKFFKD